MVREGLVDQIGHCHVLLCAPIRARGAHLDCPDQFHFAVLRPHSQTHSRSGGIWAVAVVCGLFFRNDELRTLQGFPFLPEGDGEFVGVRAAGQSEMFLSLSGLARRPGAALEQGMPLLRSEQAHKNFTSDIAGDVGVGDGTVGEDLLEPVAVSVNVLFITSVRFVGLGHSGHAFFLVRTVATAEAIQEHEPLRIG